MNQKCILIIEDEKKLLMALSEYLNLSGYKTYTAMDGMEGLRLFHKYQDEISLVLLDIMMPFMNGDEVLKRIRLDSQVPVIMITAKEEVEDQLNSFSLGADDYIVKPYSLAVVKVHIEAVLKRLEKSNTIYQNGNIRLEVESRCAYLDGVLLDLTPKEFDILHIFLKNENKVMTREMLLDLAWGYQYEGGIRTIDTIIKQLRKKFGEELDIKTIYGIGYQFRGSSNE